jgi:hypothetical protein
MYIFYKSYLVTCIAVTKGAQFPQGPGRCDSADILVQKLRGNKRSAYTERPTPPLVEKEAAFLNTYMCKREQKSWSWILRRPEAKNDCAGEDQQHFDRTISL